MSDIPQPVIDVLKEIGETAKTSTWDCHGTRVILHKALEKSAAHREIEFEEPRHLVTDPANKQVAIQVIGSMRDAQGKFRTEWSIGEVSPANCKNAYPFAMAEKRAKDRVILKLAGLHGYVYSEDEAEDFKESPHAELLAYNEAVRENIDFVFQVKEAVANEEWDMLRAIIEETPNDVKLALNRAPSKGGIFTTHEVKCMKQNPKGDK
jgi:hypothetical protein